MTDTASNNGLIRIRGARQNNLKNIDLIWTCAPETSLS